MKNSKIESNEEFFADEFFKLMEHYITRDFGMITISSDVINYRVSIFRKNGIHGTLPFKEWMKNTSTV